MPEWLVERGIGETRFALVDKSDIIEARIELDGILPAGTIVAATLTRSGRNGVARDADGAEYLLPAGAPGVTEGAPLHIVVTRSAIPGIEPWKRPLAKACKAAEPDEQLAAREGVLPDDWDELIEEARTGIVRFGGGELRIVATPAMTLLDVDGTLPLDELAVAGARAAARAIRRLAIGGSIGIDLPTAGKSARQAAAQAIDELMVQPFERTAVNGFGFIQIVRPRRGASLIELAADRASFEARILLRRAASSVGAFRLAVHPAVAAAIKSGWLEQLGRNVGGQVSLRVDPAIPMSGGYAEPV